ncbi:MAG: AAA family ATPase [Gammaproteobacteria bacterium]|nr:AAA family ATPase [Gammaproteobacteria bacterium]
MYLRYFGLDEMPFSITPDPAFVFLSARHRDALAHLLYGIGQGGSGGFVQLTGEVGTGKTTLCRCLLEQIPEGTHIALLLNPLVTPRELLAAISEELGIDISDSIDSTRLLVDGLNRYLLDAHALDERVVVVIDEAQNLSPEALEQVRLLTNLETSKEKLLQIVLLGQPELRELLQRRNLRQLAQRITARYHLSPLGPKDTHLYIRHRMQIAGAQRNPFRRGAMNALYQRSQGIPRLINIIADRSLLAAFAKERMDVTAAMVHDAANEVQLGERQVKSVLWPKLLGAFAALVVVVLAVAYFSDIRFPSETAGVQVNDAVLPVVEQELSQGNGPVKEQEEDLVQTPPVVALPVVETEPGSVPLQQELTKTLDSDWLENHQKMVWQGLADIWRQPSDAFAIQVACNGDNSLGYACLRNQGNWSRIKRLGLPVVLVLQEESISYVLLRGVDENRLLVGTADQLMTVSKQAVETSWLGAYLVAWPQAPGWPPFVGRGNTGPAVDTIMEMATRVDVPYHGEPVFNAAFELWLKTFQLRNGLEADGIVGRNTLLHLMTASIEEPQLLQVWELN